MPTSTYWKNVALKAVVNSPQEDIVYAVFTEFLTQLQSPQERFVIYPQLSLKWKPHAEQDRRAEVPDVGVGNLTLPGTSPTFKLRFGVEAKRSTEAMQSLPSPSTILAQDDVITAFHRLFFRRRIKQRQLSRIVTPLLIIGLIGSCLSALTGDHARLGRSQMPSSTSRPTNPPQVLVG